MDVATGGTSNHGFTEGALSRNSSHCAAATVPQPPPTKKRKLNHNVKSRQFKRPRTIQQKLEEQEGGHDSDDIDGETVNIGNLDRIRRVDLRSNTSPEPLQNVVAEEEADCGLDGDRESNDSGSVGIETEDESISSDSDEEQGVQCNTGVLPKRNKQPISRSVQCCIGYMVDKATQTVPQRIEPVVDCDTLQTVETQNQNFIDSAWSMIGQEK